MSAILLAPQWDSSDVNISGGIIYRLESGYSANVNIIDGQIANQLSASSSVPMNILGGDIETLVARQLHEINVYGGLIRELAISASGRINFYGSDFETSFIGVTLPIALWYRLLLYRLTNLYYPPFQGCPATASVFCCNGGGGFEPPTCAIHPRYLAKNRDAKHNMSNNLSMFSAYFVMKGYR